MNLNRRHLLLALALTVLGFALMVGAEHAGAGPGESSSQLQLQFAWSAERTHAVLTAWGEAGRNRVANGFYGDNLFLVGYGWLLWQLLAAACRRKALAWLPVIAAGLDAVENGLLLGMIRGGLDAGITPVVSLVASLKFALIGIAVICLLVAWSRRVRSG